MVHLEKTLTSREQAHAELKQHRMILGLQARSIVGLGFVGLFVMFIQHHWFGFFVYPYLNWSISVNTLVRFWPLFAYAGVGAILSSLSLHSTESDTEIFLYGVLASVLAGIREELGFRWLFICTSMIGLMVSNWFLGTLGGSIFIILILALGVISLGLGLGERSVTTTLGGVALTVMGSLLGYAIWYLGYNDPVYWLWRTILLPITDVLSFGYLTDILHSRTIPTLFMFGALAANVRFRDGHKYQGIQGMVNAWYVGLVLLYATITYGLGTAIVLHVLYDLEIDTIRFVARKVVDR